MAGPEGQTDWGSYGEVLAALRNRERVAVFLHKNPDGDSLGSSLALAAALRYFGATVTVIAEDKFPAIYNFLTGSDAVLSAVQAAGLNFDTAIMPDVADTSRLGKSLAVAETIPYWINIDHHGTNPGFGQARWVDPTRSSVGEMILELIWGLGVPFSVGMAEAVYTAILTDTGAFRYDSTSPQVHRYAAYLIGRGVAPGKVAKHVYESMPISAFKLLVAALDNLQLEAQGQVASLSVTRALLAETGALASDMEGIINYARRIDGVEVAILFYEEPDNTVRVSLRAKEWVDVGQVAAALGGGGHARAAGITLAGPLVAAQRQALAAVHAALDRRLED